jgi:hypothetical protein
MEIFLRKGLDWWNQLEIDSTNRTLRVNESRSQMTPSSAFNYFYHDRLPRVPGNDACWSNARHRNSQFPPTINR